MTPSTATNSLKPTRRTYAAADKSRILEEYDAASTPLERASIMRREGVYASLIAYWRKQSRASTTTTATASPAIALKAKRGRPSNTPNAETQRLKAQIERLRTRAERAEDLLETLGKVHAFLQNAVSKNVKEPQRSKKP